MAHAAVFFSLPVALLLAGIMAATQPIGMAHLIAAYSLAGAGAMVAFVIATMISGAFTRL